MNLRGIYTVIISPFYFKFNRKAKKQPFENGGLLCQPLCNVLYLTEERENAENDVDKTVYLHEKSDDSAEDIDDGKACNKTDNPTDKCAEYDADYEPNDKRYNVALLCLEAERPKFLKKIHG